MLLMPVLQELFDYLRELCILVQRFSPGLLKVLDLRVHAWVNAWMAEK